MKIWAKTDGEFREGKYLVVRRDGSVPEWPHFVIGGFDPAGGTGLAFYAAKAADLGFDAEYVASIQELAADFDALSATPHAKAIADPDAGPHRKDCPAVIEMMRGNGDVAALVARLSEAEAALAVCRQSLIEQADARVDTTMPVLTASVIDALRADAEANYAMAVTREDRVYAHGLSLLCDWQDRARSTGSPDGR